MKAYIMAPIRDLMVVRFHSGDHCSATINTESHPDCRATDHFHRIQKGSLQHLKFALDQP